MSDIPNRGNLNDFIATARRKIREAQGKAKYFPPENPTQASANVQIANKFPDSGRDSRGRKR